MKFYSGLTIFILSVIPVFCWSQEIQIIPKPVSIEPQNGQFIFKKGIKIGYSNDSIREIATWFMTKFNRPTSLEANLQKGNSGEIILDVNSPKNPELANEGYELEVNTSGILIKANSKTGIFYGLQTLTQLLPPGIESNSNQQIEWSVPCVKIKDFPRFSYRGMMLDVSRHFFTKEEVKKYIEEISRYKFNRFHWHLTDDNGWRIEIKSFPRLTSVGAWRVPRTGTFGSADRKAPQKGEKANYGGFYTQQEIREVVEFAKGKGIEIIPEIDIPGHCMAAIAAYPELSCTKDTNTRVNAGNKFSDWFGNGTFKMNVDNSLNPSDEKVYQFLDKVFEEIALLFPGKYIHVGGDECYKGFWEKDQGCKDLMEKLKIRHIEDLQGYFMNRVKDIIKSKGKKVIGWDEVMEGGMSNAATIMFWRGWQAKDILPMAKKGGYKLIMTPTNTNYFDYYQGDQTIEPPVYASLRLKNAYSFNPVPPEIDEKMVLGGQSNLWTEKVENFRHAEYMTFPRAWATSEVLWSPKGTNSDWNDFIKRVEFHMPRAEMAGIKVAKSIYDPIVEFKKIKGELWVELNSEVPGTEIYYTLDESMPDQKSNKYSTAFFIPLEGTPNLRIRAFRNQKPIGNLLTYNVELLKSKMK